MPAASDEGAPGLIDVIVEAPPGMPAAEQARLAARIEGRYGVPAGEVARRLPLGPFRCFRALARDVASRLAADLRAIGVDVRLVETADPAAPATGATSGSRLELADLDQRGEPTGGTAGGFPGEVPDTGLELVALDGGETKGPTGRAGTHGLSMPASPTSASPASASPTLSSDLFAPPEAARPIEIELADRPFRQRVEPVVEVAPRPASTSLVARPDSVGLPSEAPIDLESDADRRRRLATSDPNAMFGGPALSGEHEAVTVPAAQSGGHIVRCVEHGLYFDRRVDAGCKRCRAATATTTGAAGPGGRRLLLGGRLRARPSRRALIGFGFSLALGLLPAAWCNHHARIAQASLVDAQRRLQTDPRVAVDRGVAGRLASATEDLSAARTDALIETLLVWGLAAAAAAWAFFRYT